MKRLLMAAAIAGALFLPSAVAQDEKEFAAWMKALPPGMGATRKAIEAKSGPDAAMSAKKIAEIFGSVEAYFVKAGGAADAVASAKAAKEAAAAAGMAAEAGKFEDAGAAFAKVGGSCKGCHDAHREKLADGTYKFK